MNPLENTKVRGSIAIMLLALAGSLSAPLALADSFDAPQEKKIVDLGPSPYAPAGRIRLSCFFYSGFLVKEYNDEGLKGSEWLAIAPSQAEPRPVCSLNHAQGERIIESREWRGYFKGAKGNLVFFYAADGTDGGMPFVVYDSRSGTKIFEDSTFDAKWLHPDVEAAGFNEPQFFVSQQKQVSVRYLRVVEADCDLHKEGAACWEQVRKKLKLKTTQAPVCTRYKDITSRWVSAIAYPVEVSFSPKPVRNTTSGPVMCWPTD